ncbi:MAG: transposase zinc-binding domain-containing protein [Blautia sp.]|nr:transposase zinc-binding domain-containing protein [Blautia sp.]MDY4053400.1 transposase zinc-binding domain-containing protein [Blautia sp.]
MGCFFWFFFVFIFFFCCFFFGCFFCGLVWFVFFRCHCRFCTTCGNKYAMERTSSMSFKLVNVTHRHCVFTIDENLRAFF